MALFLVQHGKNLPKDEDPQKGLSTEGREAVHRIADLARQNGVQVAAVLHSGKKRARETAEIMAAFLTPHSEVKAIQGLAPLDDVRKLNPKSDAQRMLVGHLPFMEKLISYLIAGIPDRPPIVKFQNGGIVCLEQVPQGDVWFIKWTLFPRMV